MSRKSNFSHWLFDPLPKDADIPWIESIDEIASNHAQVSGNMGAFSIPVFVLLYTTYFDGSGKLTLLTNQSFILGLFLLSTFNFMLTSILYSISIKQDELHQFMIFSCSGFIYLYAAITIFCGFHMLTQKIPILSLMTVIMMIGSFLGGYFAAWIPMRIAFRLPLISGVIIFLVSTGLACLISFYLITSAPENIKIVLYFWFAISLGFVLLVFVVNAMSFTYLEPLTINHERELSQISLLILSTLSFSTILITLSVNRLGI